MTILDAVKESRNAKVKAALDIVYQLIEKLTAEEDNECKQGPEQDSLFCDAMMLGSLLKGAAQIGIWPKLEASYVGQTVQDLRANIAEVKLTDLSIYKRTPPHLDHEYTKFISISMKGVEDQYNGVKLWDFKRRR